MSEKRCEFEQYCMVEENTICADAEDYLECDEYRTLCLVFNNAIEEVQEKFRAWGHAQRYTGNTVIKNIEILKKPASREGV